MNKRLLLGLIALVFVVVIGAPISYAQLNGTGTNGTEIIIPPITNGTGTNGTEIIIPPLNGTEIIILNGTETPPVNNTVTPPIQSNDNTPIEFASVQVEDFSNIGSELGSANVKKQYREETSFTKVFELIDGDLDDIADDVYVTALGLPVEIVDYNENRKSYVKTENAQAISVSSGQVTFSFDKQTCSGTIHNAGLLKAGQTPEISSSSYIIRVAVNGTNTWAPINEINNATCTVETFEDGKSIEIRGTKFIDGIGEMKIRYIKLYHQGLKPQIEFTNLNPSWINHKFSIIGTDHVPEVITIANQTVNIKTDPSPTLKNRDDLDLNNKKLKMKIGELEYDSLTGNDQVWSVNTVYENNISKLVVDYSNQEGAIYLPGETLILDPIYTNNNNPTEDGLLRDDGTNNILDGNSLTISTSGTSHDIGRYAIVDGMEGGRTYYEWSVPPTIPYYSLISNVTFIVQNGAPEGTSDGCDYLAMSIRPSQATTQQKWDDIGDGTVYVNDDSTCNASGTDHSVNLGSSAITDMISVIQSSRGWFAIGIKSDVEGALDTSYHVARFHSEENTGTPDPTLVITYTLPVPTAPVVAITSDTPTSKTVKTTTNSTTTIGSVLGYYWERIQNSTNFKAQCNEPFDGSCQGLLSRFTLDGPATGLKDSVIGNVTTIVDQQIAPAMGFYEFESLIIKTMIITTGTTTQTATVDNNPYWRHANKFANNIGIVTQVDVDLKRTGSPTGNIIVGKYNSGGTLVTTFGTLDSSTISTSKTTYSFNTTSDTVASGEYIGIAHDSGTRDVSNYIGIYGTNGDTTPNVNDWVYNGSWLDNTPADIYMKLYILNVANQATIENYNITSSFSDAYNTNSGWTQTGTTVTVDSGVADKVAYISAVGNTNNRVTKALGFTLSDTSWIHEFEFNVTAVSTGDGILTAFKADIGAWNSISDGVAFIAQNISTLRVTINTNNGGTEASGTTLVLGSLSAKYYATFTRSGDVFTIQVFSDSGRTVSLGSVTKTTAGITGLNTLYHGTRVVGDTGSLTATVDNSIIYNNISGVPHTGSRDGYISGAIKSTGNRDTSLNFDGIDDFVELKNTKGLFELGSPFTISAWIKPDTVNTLMSIVSSEDASTCSTPGVDLLTSTTARVILVLCQSITTSTQVESEAYVLSVGNWYHVVGTYDGTNGNEQLQLYINSVLVDDTESDAGGGDPTTISNAINLFVGRDPEDVQEFDGSIDDVGIFGRVLTVSEIASIYNLGSSKDIVTDSSTSTDVSDYKLQTDYNFDNNNYITHTFTSSGTFTVTGSGNVEYLVVGGGGGGGASSTGNGGGGGAGGFRTATGFAVSTQAYPITVGAGGTAGTNSVKGGYGGNSTFSTITSIGGGFGGNWRGIGGVAADGWGGNGGSGGGGGQEYTGAVATGTVGQGNDGGININLNSGGGGGGAGGVGGDSQTPQRGGVGGAGLYSSLSGTSFAGGGGASTHANCTVDCAAPGGSGGGTGADAGVSAATAGTSNTGGGGGGGGEGWASGAGGSGIVIIRYLTSSNITATGGTITTNQAINQATYNSALDVWGTDANSTSETFATFINEADSDASWISTDESKVDVNLSTDKLDWTSVRDGTVDVIDYDLGAILTNDWTLRFAFNVTSITVPSSLGLYQWFGLADELGSGATIDAIGFSVVRDSTTGKFWRINAVNEGNPIDGADQGTLLHQLVVERIFVEILKSGTSYTLNLFSDPEYINLVESKTASIPAGADNFRYFKTRNISSSSASGSINGTIDDIVVYNNFVPLYHKADGVVSGATVTTGKHGEAFNFDGVDDKITSVDPFINNQDYSIAFWFNSDVIDVGDSIISTLSSTYEQQDFQIGTDSSESVIFYKRTAAGTDVDILQTAASTIVAGQWIHVVAVYNDAIAADAANLPTNAMKLYINGVMVDNTPADSVFPFTATSGLIIGSDSENRYYDGKIDDLKMYNRMLTDAEILTLAESFPVQTGKFAEIASVFYELDALHDVTVHTFTSDGTFDVTSGSGNVEYLVVAGGGGGCGSATTGGNGVGGGGAGGFRTGSLSVTAQDYTIIIGAKGIGGSALDACNATSGGNSTFSTITSNGGGNGGGYASPAAASGGSGGGGQTGSAGGAGNTPSTSPSQGNNGGAGLNSPPNYGAGGGGGSSGNGGAGTTTTGGAGGGGTSNDISGLPVIYAGGGGGGYIFGGGTGGAGGSGGGGAGNGNADAFNATGYGSGGGGAGGTTSKGGYGSSGIVIIRYQTDSGIVATGGTITNPISVDNHATIENYNPTVTLDENFSGCTTDNCNTYTLLDSTVPDGSKINTSTDKIEFAFSGDGTNDGLYNNLGFVLGNSFTFRTVINVTSVTPDLGSYICFGFSDKQAGLWSTVQDMIGFRMYSHVSSDALRLIGGMHLNNNDCQTIDIQGTKITPNPLTTTTYPIELIRYSDTMYEARLYTDNTFTNIVQSSGIISMSAGTVTNLKTFFISNFDPANSGAIAGTFDDIKIYNNFATIGTIADGSISDAVNTTGIRDTALDFDGTNDYVDTNINKGFLDTTQTFSASMWLNPDVSQTNTIMSQSSAGDAAVAIWLTSNKPQFYIEDAGSLYNTCTTTNALQSGQWSHVVLTVTGQASRASSCTNVNLYINGVAETIVTGGSGTVDSIATTENLFIGAKHGTSSFYNGKIDDFTVFLTALSSSQVQQLYNTGNSLDVIDGFTGANNTLVYPYLTKKAGTNIYNTTPMITLQNSGNTFNGIYGDSGQQDFQGIHVKADSALNGKEVTEISFWVKKSGSPSGTATVGVYNSAYVLQHTFGTFDPATLTTSEVKTTFSTGSYVVGTGDRIGMTCDNPTCTLANHILFHTQNTDVYDSTNTVQGYHLEDGGYLDNDTQDLRFEILTIPPSAIASSMRFDGSTYYTTATEKETLYDFEKDDPFSTSFWVSASAIPSGSSTILHKYDNVSALKGWYVVMDSDEKIQFALLQDSGTNTHVCVTSNPISTSLTHITTTYNGNPNNCTTDVRIYINGVSVPLTETSAGTVSSTILNNVDLQFGADHQAVPANYYNGILDDVRIYNVELTPAEVQNLYLYRLSSDIITDTFLDSNPSVGYSYAAKGVNQNGFSSLSAFANANSNYTVPGAPTALNISTISTSQLNLSWTAPSNNGNSAITGYKIERESPTGGGFTTIIADTGSTSTSYNNTILLSGTQYNYKVSAINAVGTGSASTADSNYTLNVAPTSLVASAIDGDQINLTWTAPSSSGDDVVTGYKIERESPTGGGFTIIVANTNSTSTSYSNTNLTSGTQYNYRTSAINAGGTGAVSNTDDATTLPNAPTNLLVVSYSQTQLNLSWTAPVYDGGANATSYKIERESPTGGGFSTLVNDTGNLNTTYNNTSLTSATQYNYKVSAYTTGGISVGITNSNYTLPNAPTGLTTGSAPKTLNTITLSWTAPSGTINGYLIQRESPIGGGFSTIVSNYTGGTVYVDTGLTEATIYNYRVAARVNPIGPYSGESNGTTLSRPSTITSVTASIPDPDLDPFNVLLVWTAPASLGSNTVIVDYGIDRSLNAGAYYPYTNNTNSTALSIIIPYSIADVGATYTYKVRSNGDVTLGNFSGASNSITIPNVPGTVTGLTVLPNTDNTSMVLSWTAPASNGSGINGYKIERNTNGAGFVVLVANTGSASVTYTNTGLTASTTYQYRVSAINGVGTGAVSSAVTSEFTVAVLTPVVTGSQGTVQRFDLSVNMTYGIPNNDVTAVWLKYFTSGNIVATNTGVPFTMAKGTTHSFPPMYDSPEETTEYYIQVRTHNGITGQIKDFVTPKITVTPTHFFTNQDGNLHGNELRNSTYTGSILQLTGSPAIFDLVVVYREKNNLSNVETFTWGDVPADINYTNPVLSDRDYYVSAYFNPTFVYTIGGAPEDGTATIPIGYPIDISLTSYGDPSQAPFSLGIDVIAGESGIFGLPLVFIFIIALASVFTGRTSPMGIIFVAVAIGLMAYMGMIDFNFDPANNSNIATWAIIIIAVIVGVLIGKRWD